MHIRAGAFEKLLVFLASAVATGLLSWRQVFWTPDSALFWKPYDHWTYIWMATHPFEKFGMAPFCWRVLAPWTIGVLDAGESANYFQRSFWWLAVAGIVVGAGASYGIGKRVFGTRESGWLCGCWFLSFYWAAKAPLGIFVYLDGATYGLTALLVYLLVARRDALFVIALALGVTFKESALFCLPLFYCLRASRWKLELPPLARTLAVAMPALCVLLLLRTTIPARNDDAAYRATLPVRVRQSPIIQIPYSYPTIFRAVTRERAKTFAPSTVWRWTGGTFGVAALLLCGVGIWARPRFALRWLPFVVLCFVQLAFAVNDERLLIIAFPAVLVFVLAGTHHLAKRFDAPLWSFAFLPLALCALNIASPFAPSLRSQLLALAFFVVPFALRRARFKTPI